MRKKSLFMLALVMMIGSATACGSNKATVVTSTMEPTDGVEATQEAEITEETTQPELAGEATEAPAQQEEIAQEQEKTENQSNSTSSEKTEKKEEATQVETATLEGEFYGFADGTSVEVGVDGQVGVYRVGTDDVNAALSKLEDGAVFIFEIEKVGDVQTITHVFE